MHEAGLVQGWPGFDFASVGCAASGPGESVSGRAGSVRLIELEQVGREKAQNDRNRLFSARRDPFNGDVYLNPGQFVVVPRGVRHNPVADEECWIMLIETVTTKHTGDAETPLTRSISEQLT